MLRQLLYAAVALSVSLTHGVLGSTEKEMILEKKFTFRLMAQEVKGGSVPRISVSGLCGHSAMTVKEVRQRTNASEINIMVIVEPAKAGATGTFAIDVPVTSDTRCITFGGGKEVIWRSAGNSQKDE
jgi:hypothetical protein